MQRSEREHRVWKYPLPNPGTMMRTVWPVGAKVVHVGMQHGEMHAWLRVDPSAPQQQVTLLTVGTGHPFAPTAEHVGTVIDSGGFVWHAFAAREELAAPAEREGE